MKQNIERTYIFTAIEVKKLLTEHLLKLDRPAPKNAGSLTVTWNGDGDVQARFFEVLDFDKPNPVAS